jgi:hypothetical protein
MIKNNKNKSAEEHSVRVTVALGRRNYKGNKARTLPV